MKNDLDLESSWQEILQDEFQKPYMKELLAFLDHEQQAGKEILPEKSLWFQALNLTPLNEVKVVILGQDPYPTLGHAHGLCFSVLPEVTPLAKSLQNINKELIDDLNIDNSHTGYLEPWAKQGVLLLNAVLTVEAGKPNAHQGKGWEAFTDSIIKHIDKHCDHVVFILWGGYAQKKGKAIDSTKHLILKSPHPSPLSAYRGFFGSQPFSRTNAFLETHGKEEIHWAL